MAIMLSVALSGPRSYDGAKRDFPFVYPEGTREVDAKDIEASTRVLWRSWAVGLAVVAVLAVAT